MVPSKDFHCMSKGAQGVKRYFTETEWTSARLAGMFHTAFPIYYKKYKKAFEAGRWLEEDKGCHRARFSDFFSPMSLHLLDSFTFETPTLFCFTPHIKTPRSLSSIQED